MADNKFTFEEVFKQNERRNHYYIHKLKINDPSQEFYQEGWVAMWNAYESYQPDKSPMATYFNYIIRNRMIDLIRKQKREQENEAYYSKVLTTDYEDGNHYNRGQKSYQIKNPAEEHALYDQGLSEKVKSQLSENQWKWVVYFIISDMSFRGIAEQERVSVEAVKSWGREARRKWQDR